MLHHAMGGRWSAVSSTTMLAAVAEANLPGWQQIERGHGLSGISGMCTEPPSK
jgi:hypothetical protein